jgi:signal transduction histidine kinase
VRFTETLSVEPEVWELFHPSIAPSDGDMYAYLERIVEKCTPLFDAAGASIFLRRDDGRFHLEAQFGTVPPIPENAIITPGEGVAGACIDLAEPLLVKDVRSEIVFKGRLIQPRADVGSAMVVPLIVPHGAVLGVMNVTRRQGDPDFSHPDLARAASLAHQVALAVSAARLLAETKQAQAWLAGLMECVPAAVLVISADGSIAEANRQGKAILDERPEWLNPDLTCGRSKVFDANTNKVWRLDCLPAGDGRVLIVEDVTEQENEAEETARVRRLAEIGQMSAAVAHEIRNPLTGIRAATQLLIQNPEQNSELAEIIDEEVMRLSNLCEDFLEFARPLTLKMRSSTMSHLVKKIARLEKPVADQLGIRLLLAGDDETPEIGMDANRVEQVLRNLLRNAIQACEPGGTCTIRYRADGFEVEDTGSGMSPTTLRNLFVPFYTTKPKGTGLGLSNTRKIVEAHGGKLSVHSVLGEGSKFVVQLGRAA